LNLRFKQKGPYLELSSLTEQSASDYLLELDIPINTLPQHIKTDLEANSLPISEGEGGGFPNQGTSEDDYPD